LYPLIPFLQSCWTRYSDEKKPSGLKPSDLQDRRFYENE
jgi:hypothetical protein